MDNLLNRGAYVNSHNNGFNPIYITNVNERQKKGISPMYIVCQNGNFSIVQLLLSNGAEINGNKEKELRTLYIAH